MLDDYSAKWKREDLHKRWLSAAEAIILGVSDDWVLRKSLSQANEEIDEETLHDLENQVGAYGRLKRSDFPNDFAYTKAIIRHVRRAHSIDDRLENARRESISNNFLTRTKQPQALSTTMPTADGNYHLKAIVPLAKSFYRTIPRKPKPIFELIETMILKEQRIFGVLTAKHSGYIPPVYVCDQDWDMKSQSSQVLYSFEDCTGPNLETCKIEAESTISALRNREYGLPPE